MATALPIKKKRGKRKWDSDEEEDWEGVEERDNPINYDDVDVDFGAPKILVNQQNKGKRKRKDIRMWLNVYMNFLCFHSAKIKSITKHKAHLVCLLANGRLLNSVCNMDILKGMMLSLVSPNLVTFTGQAVSEQYIKNLSAWIHANYFHMIDFKNHEIKSTLGKACTLLDAIMSPKGSNSGDKQHSLNTVDFVLLHVILFRAFGIQTRLVMSWDPITFKPPSRAAREKESNEKYENWLNQVRESRLKAAISEHKKSMESPVKDPVFESPKPSAESTSEGKSYSDNCKKSDENNQAQAYEKETDLQTECLPQVDGANDEISVSSGILCKTTTISQKLAKLMKFVDSG